MYSKGNNTSYVTWLALTLLDLEIQDISKVELKQQIAFSSLILAQNKPKTAQCR